MIKKDLYLMLNNRRLFYIVLVLYLGMSILGGQDYTLFIPFMLLMMFLTSFSYDDFNSWHGYGAVLPQGRENYVKGKYVTVIVLSVVSCFFSLLLSFLIGSIKHEGNLMDSLSILAGITGAMLLLISILFPIIFKFGYEKGRIALFIVSFGISGIVIFLGTFFQTRIPESLILFLEKYGIYLAALITIAMLYVSYRISRKIYLNKEL